MSLWDIYQSRLDSIGATKRDAKLRRESRYLSAKVPDNLSYATVNIDGLAQEVAIISTDNLNEKFVYSLPGEDITPGGLIEWMDNHWLVVEKDVATELYARAKMVQCNYLIKWVDTDHIIHEQWCVIEDGTKYLTGQYEDREFFVTRGDSRLGMIIARNEHTAKMRRGCRFLIDDADSELMLAYELSKPFKLSGVYNNQGIFKFVLQEVNTTDDDNQELCIADYYKHFPKDAESSAPNNTIDPDSTTTDDGRKVWL
jgi:hypothetical protein